METITDLNYCITPVDELITIEGIISMHYFEFVCDYVFEGESHNFWEFLYVDNGQVEIMADSSGYRLEQGDIVFHKPNEFHSVWGDGNIAPNIIVMSFICNSPAMEYFENKILRISASMRNLLSEIIKEGKNTYKNDLGGGYKKLIKKESAAPDSEQLIKIYIEFFLIKLIREGNSVEPKGRLSSITKERIEGDIVDRIIEYLQEHTNEHLGLEDISQRFFICKTRLKTMFKKRTGQGVVSYFNKLKMEEAKKLIRENKYNITEISEMLAFDSIHYFSKCFKKYVNMSPSQYAVSAKARFEI